MDMRTPPQKQPIPVADYLSGELISRQKHEFVDGTVYAMSGASARHNRVATNFTISLGSQLRGKPCEVFNSDMKIRVRQSRSVQYYYPDLSVVCQPNPDTDLFQVQPVIVVEVLCDSTRRVDEVEKRDTYLTINSLTCYLLLEQDTPCGVLYRRGENGFEREDYVGLDTAISLPEIQCELLLAEAYANVTFPVPAPSDEET
ncbi:MAG: Uma2 family endonuclease [Pirellulaceae bacterium]|nr:Uma2 family endonuclease [Pirellulaceae bacterium]